MTIKEGIVLCKRTGKLLGFEDNNIPQEYNIKPEEFVDNESENESFCDSSSDSNSEYNSNTSQSDDEQNKMKEAQFPQEKAKMMCQFFSLPWRVTFLGQWFLFLFKK